MANEIALGFVGEPDADLYWFFFRSTGEHSGNISSLERAYKKFFLEKNKMPIGYYTGRKLTLVAGISLIKWSEE